MTLLDCPPKDWKRPKTPERVKLQVLLNQDGRCKATGERLGTVANCHFDHRPALWERRFDPKAWDTVPPANDPDHIEAITVDEHDRRTNGPGGTKRITTAGSDTGRRTKIRHVVEREVEHREALKAKASGRARAPSKRKQKIPPRPFSAGRGFKSARGNP